MSLLCHFVSMQKCSAWYYALMTTKMTNEWLIWSEPAVYVMLVPVKRISTDDQSKHIVFLILLFVHVSVEL